MKLPVLSSFARRLRREWRVLNLPAENQTIVIAVSGGADSVALLAAANELIERKKLSLAIVAAHFNHRLRGEESDRDAEFVQHLAEKFDFDFVGGEWNSKSETPNLKENLEQAARRARYRFLFDAAQKQNAAAVLTAHTLNDQAETFLLRLIRGSGLDGLGAMKPITNCARRMTNDFEENNSRAVFQTEFRDLQPDTILVRPLLNWAQRRMTEDYCLARGIEFRNDSMNEDKNFVRVRVRRELLPLLEIYNPQIINQLAQTARLIREDAEELNAAAKNLIDAAAKESALDARILKKKSAALRRRAARLWLEQHRGSLKRIEAKHFAAIDELLQKGAGGSFIELPGGGIVIKKANLLIFEQRG